MIPYWVKFKGYMCFKDQWAGFDQFKAINVIVGRNNTGKSQLLDIVQRLTVNDKSKQRIDFQFRARLTEEFLKRVFPENRRGGELGGNDHWRSHGRHFIDQEVAWDVTDKIVTLYPTDDLVPGNIEHNPVANARHTAVQANLSFISCHLNGRQFRRILADRDIRPERAMNELKLGDDGAGATHLIYRFITNRHLDGDLISEKLRGALNSIFGDDGQFHRIEIQQQGEVNASDEDSLWEIFLREPKKGLIPLSRSGSGLKTIFLVLLNLLVIPEVEKKPISEFVYAFEELENNLHPALLRRLFRYLSDFVTKEGCTLFLTTHSNVALDFFGIREDSQIIQVSHCGESASTNPVEAHFDRVGLLSELGARPSDLLQANGVLWLEGPSDRIYFNTFIDLFSNGELKEGRDYQCAYYGGSVLAKTEFSAPEDAEQELVNLLRLNNNIAVICDGDRTAADGEGSELKVRVQRIEREVTSVPDHFFWATESKEIENYIPGAVWSSVYAIPGIPDPGPFDKFPAGSVAEDCFVVMHSGRKSFDKCKFATDAAPYLTMDLMSGNGEFVTKIQKLVETIRKWNR